MDSDSDNDGGGSAFPAQDYGMLGITARDYFAAKAMQELLSQDGYEKFELVAQDAYKMADAMLKARQAG